MSAAAAAEEVVREASDDGALSAAEHPPLCKGAPTGASADVATVVDGDASRMPVPPPAGAGGVLRPVFTGPKPEARRWWTFFFVLRLWMMLSKVTIDIAPSSLPPPRLCLPGFFIIFSFGLISCVMMAATTDVASPLQIAGRHADARLWQLLQHQLVKSRD